MYSHRQQTGPVFNPNFHCPGPIGPWVFWMLVAQNIIMYEKYEKNMYSSKNVFWFFFTSGFPL